ncbi:hypothetical protein COV19_07475 [Candidatus Woesearchaeota archaeon CG10_big_fil_rev_8_21_14_0_10_44_13]|nr:MAG: hypothetical protein COV19_07475 [Candidatus Woesearchaeota archaeon CG10_big_fil_rev_8_21_14_0_10_44_13]
MSLILTATILTSCKKVEVGENTAKSGPDSISADVVGSKEAADAPAGDTAGSEDTTNVISKIVGKAVMSPECSKASLSFFETDGRKDVCIYRNSVSIVLINDGEIELSGFDLYVKGKDSDEVVVNMRSAIGIGSMSRQIIRYDSQRYGELEGIRVVPVLSDDGEEAMCSEKGIEENDINDCG